MKKSKEKKLFLRRLALLLPLMVIVGVAAWRTAAEHREQIVGQHPLSMAASRHVENVVCSGVCSGVMLVSDQEPDVQYYDGSLNETCSEAMVWANKGREGQIMFGGYQFVNGYQVNLPTQTVGIEALDGADIEFTLPEIGTSFNAHVKNTGEWNLLDTVECNQLSCPGFTRVFTDRDSGRVKLYDSCSSVSDSTDIYALYQSPEIHGVDENGTYRVDIGKRESFGTGWDGGEPKVFEHYYLSSELVVESIHVIADVGDTTFEFDLVKDEE